MDLELENPIQQQATNELSNGQVNLQELLGKDWLERSVYSNVEVAFTPSELHAVVNKKMPSAETARTGVERNALEINQFFDAKGGSYRAYVLEYGDRQQLAVIGTVGEDLVYITRKAGDLSSPLEAVSGPMFTPEVFAIISSTGGVWRIDRMLEDTHYTLHLKDGGSEPNKKPYCYQIYDDARDESTVVASLPYSNEDVATLLHEIGHGIQDRELARNNPLALAKYKSAYNRFGSTFSPLIYDGTLGNIDFPHAKEVVMTYEKRAWEIGMAILSDVGRTIGIDAGTNGMDSFQQIALTCLEGHNRVSSTSTTSN